MLEKDIAAFGDHFVLWTVPRSRIRTLVYHDLSPCRGYLSLLGVDDRSSVSAKRFFAVKGVLES